MKDDLEEEFFVEFQMIFRKTKVLLITLPCVDTQQRCCCRKQPNPDDLEEEFFQKFQVIFLETKVLLSTLPLSYTLQRCCCRK